MTRSLPDEQRSSSQIRSAKRKAVGGRKKRCVKGKSCSATCIQPTDVCMVALPDSLTTSLSKARSTVQTSKKPNLKDEITALNGQAVEKNKLINELRAKEKSVEGQVIALKVKKIKGDEFKAANKELKAISKQLKAETESLYKLLETLGAKRDELKNQLKQAPIVKIPPPKAPPKVQPTGKDIFEKLALKQVDDWETKGISEANKVDWMALIRDGKKFGKGEYAEALTVDASKLPPALARKFPNGLVLKKGEIGDSEPEALKRAGDAGIAPRLLAARVSFQKAYQSDEALFNGLIAMGRIEGVSLYEAVNSGKVKDPYDLYWNARARLHKLGIAHNDAHNGNFIIDSQGKGRFIDFGLAVISPKNALSEALGGVTGSDRQLAYGSREGMTFNQIVRNTLAVKKAMADDGFTDAQINAFTRSGNSPRPLTGINWNQMTDSQANKYLDILYEGIG